MNFEKKRKKIIHSAKGKKGIDYKISVSILIIFSFLNKEKGNRLQYQRQYAYHSFIFKNDNAINRKKGNKLQNQRQYAYHFFISKKGIL